MNTPDEQTAYQRALDFLARHRDIERTVPEDRDEATFDLQGLREAVDQLNHPERAPLVAHVTGTKGKGSVCLMLEAFLRGSGFDVGTFVSPHLREVRERIRLNRTPVPEEQFAEGLDEVRRLLSTEDDVPELTYFEWLTLLAFHLFDREAVNATVLEVGLGGRLDSTNVVSPDLTVITTLGLDHQDFLGDTIEEIAVEKAGIIKPDVPLVTGAEDGRGLDVVLERAHDAGAPAYVLGRDVHVRDRTPQRGSSTGQRVTVELANDDRIDLYLPVPGRHQAENLALAVQGYALLSRETGACWNPGILGSAARQLSLPGRFQTIHRDPPVIIDAAHNPLACHALVDALDETTLAAPRSLLFAAARDKDWRQMLKILLPHFDRLFLTDFSSPRALDPDEAAAWIRENHPKKTPHVCSPPSDAVRSYVEQQDEEAPLLVVGSFYLAGAALEALDSS